MEALTCELIEAGGLTEGQACDFKSRIDLGEAKAKADLVDDVVAFLNRGEGRIVIGVEERGGVFAGYHPLVGDADAAKLRLQSILRDSITPEPFDIVVDSLDVSGGFLLDICIPAHGLRPYQNRITGAFYLRTGVKNRPLSRDAVDAMFESGRRQEADLLTMIDQAEAELRGREVLQTNGPNLTISVLPQAHYDRSRAPFDRGHGRLKAGPLFHDRRSAVFKGCEGGHEALCDSFSGKAVERLFVGDTWFVHAHVVHPIGSTAERVKLYELKADLTAYLDALQAFLDAEDVAGPFCIMVSISDLQASELMARAFPRARTIALPRPVRADRIAATGLADQIFALAQRSSIYA